MTFAVSKFKALLPAATFAMAAEFLMGLSDSVICGQIIGEKGLAAVNLMQGVFETVSFVSMLVAIGASVLFSTQLGAGDRQRAKGFFTLGALASVAIGLLMVLVLGVVRAPLLESFGADTQVTEAAMSYWLWYLPAAALTPPAFYLSTLCYADGDARLSLVSYIVQLVGNCALAVPLTIAMGPGGCALGTGLGAMAAILVLLVHFRRPGCMLGWSRDFRLSDLVRIMRTSFGDASKNAGKAVLVFALNAYVIARYGSEALPILAVGLMTIGIAEVFDGVGNAVQPLVSTYVGEGNVVLVKRVMRVAMRLAFIEGLGTSLLLIAFPQLMLSLVGLDDPALVPAALQAVRFVSVGLLGLAMVLLFNSYYVFIGREVLSSSLTLLAVLVVPIGLVLVLDLVCDMPAGKSTWGVWLSLGLASHVSLALVGAYLMKRRGNRAFPLLLEPAREANIRVFDLDLVPAAICATSEAVGEHLRQKGVDAARAAKAALLVEETLMVVYDRNQGRRIQAEVSVDLNDGLTLVLRDDGEIFDLTDVDARISSLRSYLVSNLMTAIPNRRNLTTTGFNRNVFKL